MYGHKVLRIKRWTSNNFSLLPPSNCQTCSHTVALLYAFLADLILFSTYYFVLMILFKLDVLLILF